MEKRLSTVSLDWSSSSNGRRFYGRKVEEYIADFSMISRRSLNDFLYKIFRYYFILDAGQKLCCQRLKMSRGDLFHWVYRIESILGRAFRETQPYSLFPLDEYFAGTSGEPCKISPVSAKAKGIPRRKPVKKLSPSLLQKIA
jgi:hypothetical protein